MPAVILFDGVCNLCNGFVAFVLERDPKGRFMFASLQSEAGIRLMREHAVPDEQIAAVDSIVLLEDGKCYVRSAAVLRIFKGLSGAWPIFWGALIVPRPLRDRVYAFVARHRYQWFGKLEQCLLPTPERKSRFL